MKRRTLGNSALSIAPLAFGGNVFGWTTDQQRSSELLDACVDHGINMIDTANMYSAWAPGHSGGESETVIGNWLKQSGKRDSIVLATKVGMPMGDGSSGLKKQYIIEQAEASLQRLNTDVIDVYYAHQDDDSTPFEESFAAFEQLIKDGKVRYIASSNYSAERLSAAQQFAKQNGLPRYIANQPEYNLFDRKGYEDALETLCTQEEMGVVTYFSLASGFLSGKYRNKEDLQNAKRAGMVEKYLNDRGLKILATLDEVSSQLNVPAATIALAWIIQRPSVTAPIASATSLEQLSQLAQATELTLPAEAIERLNAASAW